MQHITDNTEFQAFVDNGMKEGIDKWFPTHRQYLSHCVEVFLVFHPELKEVEESIVE